MPVVDIELVSDTAPGAYAESGGGPTDGVAPVFVTVMARARPTGDALARQIVAVTEIVATITGCPFENVPVLFTPDAAGRVAFGGNLVD